MSSEHTLPPSVMPMNTAKAARQHKVKPGEIAVGVIIGRTSEFFDFFVYAIASVIVFPRLVFPNLDPLDGTLYSFAIFPLAFVARPAGTFFFMAIDRFYGRGVKLTISLFLLGLSTVAIAFLPGYETLGATSAVLLAVFRSGQGLALGGGWSGLAPLLAMNAPQNRSGWYAMIPQLGAPLGLMVASALFMFFLTHLSTQDFLSWGWRYPFFVAFAINVVALFARLRIVATPEYRKLLQNRELQPAPVVETVRTQWRNIVIGAFAPLASFSLFHMVTVFPLSWVYLFARRAPETFLTLELVGCVVCVIAVIASGMMADQFGRRKMLGATAAVIAAFSGFAPQLLNGGQIGEMAYMILGFIILGLSFGQASGTVASNFSSKYRYTGSALTTDLAWLFGAGFAPFIALYLSTHFGLITSGAYLLSGAAGTLLALTVNHQLHEN